jgi:hypothetical protein
MIFPRMMLPTLLLSADAPMTATLAGSKSSRIWEDNRGVRDISFAVGHHKIDMPDMLDEICRQ